ncbi:DUF1799 domain-containing protein [Klebsiella grimontii]|uniref:DUF1799 domain-containing protein n=1 Tax=Klebsiella grimontii TaxID=2058152 RepID=UPI0021E19488|nr:DUF1799 domain-containing protein [Klebsiella grimontii]MBZ7660970.1 hypothetical protein [Klebsiella grimontii]
MTAEDYDDVVINVWPDIWPAFVVFRATSTQWRTSPGGVIGLDYSVLAWLMRVYDIADEVTAINDIQVMERVALNILNKLQN